MSDGPTQIAIAVVEHDGTFLVGERPAGKPLAGYAEFPGGRVEPGETPEEAVVRECFEETGLTVRVVSSYDNRLYEYSHDTVQLHFFACSLNAVGPEPEKPFRWVPREQLSELQFPEANESLLQVLIVCDRT